MDSFTVSKKSKHVYRMQKYLHKGCNETEEAEWTFCFERMYPDHKEKDFQYFKNVKENLSFEYIAI